MLGEVYYEPIKGDVRKVLLADIPATHRVDKSKWGTSKEWEIKYQNSLSLRVSQSSIRVYFVCPVKRGKVNTRALVIDDAGASYHVFVPTFPMPRLGESLNKLMMDLTLVSAVPVKDLVDQVRKARDSDLSLL